MAGGITDSVLEEIRVRTSLADLVSSYGVTVRRAGASLKACCPFHNEKTPSFNINESKGYYHCFGCGESGDAIKFVEKMEGLSFVDAVKKLADSCGVKIEETSDPQAGRRKRLYALMAELAQFYRRCLVKTKEAAIAREYLEKRSLDDATQEEWLIGYAPLGVAPILKWAEKYKYTPEELEAAGVILLPKGPGDHGYHRFGGRLMFSIRDRQGRVVAFSGRQIVENKKSGKYVNSPETLIFRKSNVLFGFDKAAGAIARAPHREIICCEGQIDTIRLHISGFPTAVASQGTAFTEEHARMVKRVADAAVLMYDDDGAGHKATIKVAGMLLAMEMPVRVVGLPGGDDPDSFLRTHPAADLRRLIDGAESIVSFQCRVERAKEAKPDSIDAVARISRAVLSTIAACPSAVLKASLVDEAAKLLKLPAAALAEDLEKIKAETRGGLGSNRVGLGSSRVGVESNRVDPDMTLEDPNPTLVDPNSPDPDSEPPEQAVPPPERETALMAFLMANEYERTLDGMVGQFLPPFVFGHDFTRRFVETWRDESARGEDLFGAFADGLEGAESMWMDRVLLEAGRFQASGLKPTDILQDFIRALWRDRLMRVRGNLPAAGVPEADELRLKISLDLKRFSQARWATVKEMIDDLIKNDIIKGEN